MRTSMKVFVCEDNYDAIMSCIYDAWVEAIKTGYSNVKIIRQKDLQQNLFDQYIYPYSDPVKTQKVVHSIRTKISEEAYFWTYRASLSDLEDAPDAIFRFMILGFKTGASVTKMLTEESVSRMFEIIRRVKNESGMFLERAKFNSINGEVYICHFEPKSNVISYLTTHFADRMPSENFIIIDDTRKLAGIHPKDGECYYRYLSDSEFEKLSTSETYEDEYTTMWRTFFKTIAIEQRTNLECQRNHFPKWVRKHATEFMPERSAK